MIRRGKSYQAGRDSSQLGRRLKAKTVCLLGINYLIYKMVRSIPRESVLDEFLVSQSLLFFLAGFNQTFLTNRVMSLLRVDQNGDYPRHTPIK